eukprot:gene3708-biopygen17268
MLINNPPPPVQRFLWGVTVSHLSWAAEPREWLGAIVRAPRIGFLPRNSVRAFAIRAMKWYARRHSRDPAPVPYASADKAAKAPPAFTAFCEGSTKGPWVSRNMLEQRSQSYRREATAEQRRAACEAAAKDDAAVVNGWSCRVLGVQNHSARKRYETNPGEVHRMRCYVHPRGSRGTLLLTPHRAILWNAFCSDWSKMARVAFQWTHAAHGTEVVYAYLNHLLSPSDRKRSIPAPSAMAGRQQARAGSFAVNLEQLIGKLTLLPEVGSGGARIVEGLHGRWNDSVIVEFPRWKRAGVPFRIRRIISNYVYYGRSLQSPLDVVGGERYLCHDVLDTLARNISATHATPFTIEGMDKGATGNERTVPGSFDAPMCCRTKEILTARTLSRA